MAADSSAPAIHLRPLSRWRDRPERVAWIVLLAAFATFLLLAVSVPLALRAVYHTAAVAQPVRFEPTVGTVLLYPPRSDVPIALTDRRDDVSEGSRLVTTGDATQGVIGLPLDDATPELMGTVHLYPGTSLALERVRRPRFAGSERPYTVRLHLDEGRIRLFTASPTDRPLEVQIDTPHGTVYLDEGNYAFTVSPERSEVSVTQGAARLLQADAEPVDVAPGLRMWMTADGMASSPVSAQRNLLRSGDFSQPLLQDWETYTEAPYVTPGIVEISEQDGRRVARFFRQGEDGIHTEVGIRQVVDQDVNGYDYLIVKLDVKLLRQTLPGAGVRSSEFPLRLEIAYTDIYGKDLTWGHGFYYRDPEPGWPLTGGEKIAPFVWFTYESPNLMQVLADTRPAHINSIRLYASGWNYEAQAGEVGLFVE